MKINWEIVILTMILSITFVQTINSIKEVRIYKILYKQNKEKKDEEERL